MPFNEPWYLKKMPTTRLKMEILWTKKAIEQHESLEKYLFKFWTKNEVLSYLKKLERTIEILKKFPEAGVRIDNYRRMNVTSHTAVIYKIVDDKIIVIMMIWDNRRKPIF